MYFFTKYLVKKYMHGNLLSVICKQAAHLTVKSKYIHTVHHDVDEVAEISAEMVFPLHPSSLSLHFSLCTVEWIMCLLSNWFTLSLSLCDVWALNWVLL